MDKEITTNSKNKSAAFKMGLGIIIGLALKNIAIGLVIGIVIGTFGIIINRRTKSKTK